MATSLVLTRAQARFAMLVCTLLWSTAGVVTRHLDNTPSFEVNFWRSGFSALCILLLLTLQYRQQTWQQFSKLGKIGFCSGVLWACMFTCFMLAMTQTTVSNTLLIGSLTPLVTALLSWIFLRQQIFWRTWLAILLALFGMCWVLADGVAQLFSTSKPGSLFGLLVAFLLPLSAALNFILLGRHSKAQNMLPSIALGGLVSAALTLGLAWPLQASPHDLFLLGLLGVFQLALPCILLVVAVRTLPAVEVALLGLLEVIFGIFLAWWGAGEVPSTATLCGGGIVLLALGLHALEQSRR